MSGLFYHNIQGDGLDRSEFRILEHMNWMGCSWRLQGAGLYVGSIDNGHYRSVVRSPNNQGWII